MKKLQVEKTSSRGIVIAPVYLYQEADLTPDEKKIEESQIEAEKANANLSRNIG